ncbi:MAG: hypothetical protein JKY56_25040 [Kofleriaceae bacterium]|nr:hypothetical protein [Kofleriaceae bacterium]
MALRRYLATSPGIKSPGITSLVMLSLLALLGANAHAQVSPLAEHRAAVLDLRSGPDTGRLQEREALIEELGQHGQLHLVIDAELANRLGRTVFSPAWGQGKAALELAAQHFGNLDCSQTFQYANDAILYLSAAKAAGVSPDNDTRKAYLFQFLCADRNGNVDQAMSTAAALRILTGGIRPSEISENTWRKYPEIDLLSNLRSASVSFESDSPGAELWIDHRVVGKTPMNVLLREGRHLVAMGLNTRSAAIYIDVPLRNNDPVSLRLSQVSSQWQQLGQSIDEIRAIDDDKRPTKMRELMSATEIDVFFVLEESKIAVWILASSGRTAKHLGNVDSAKEAGRTALHGLREQQRRPGLDLSMPLLRESDLPETVASAESPTRWWLYGLVIGAAAAGAGVILLQDLGQDQQRIEINLP